MAKDYLSERPYGRLTHLDRFRVRRWQKRLDKVEYAIDMAVANSNYGVRNDLWDARRKLNGKIGDTLAKAFVACR